MKIKYVFQLFSIFSFLLAADIYGQTFYILPPGGFENDKLFLFVENNDQKFNRDDCLRHFYDLRQALRSLGHDLKTTRGVDLPRGCTIILSGIPSEKKLKDIREKARKIIAFIWEPIIIEPTSYKKSTSVYIDRIFTMWDDQVDNRKYFKSYYTYPSLYMIDDFYDFNKKKLLTFISSCKQVQNKIPGELYSERKKAINFMENNCLDFTYFGMGWPKTKAYGGPVVSKKEILKQYKFSICFENTSNMNGYITEKIFDCFHAGCVPIYWGAPNVLDYIPQNCFIDFRKFKNYYELLSFIENMQESEYNLYIQNIQNFLSSNKAALFSTENFIKNVIQSIIF